MQIALFNSDLLCLGWQNKRCNQLHYLFLHRMTEKSNSKMLNLESCEMARLVIAKLAHLIPKEDLKDGNFKGEEDQLLQIIYGVDRSCSKSTDKLLEFSVSFCNKDQNFNSEYSKAKQFLEDETNPLDLVNVQVDDSSLMSWCGLDETKSKVVDSFIKDFQEGLKHKEEKGKQVRAVRKFQILIYKLLEAVNKIQVSYETQKYAFHILKMLYQMIKNDELMENQEIKEMFYTEHAMTTIFSLIIKKYSYNEYSPKSRQFGYLMLLRLFRLDIETARKSFKIWTSQSNNKYSLFKRIKDLVNEFSLYFGDPQL